MVLLFIIPLGGNMNKNLLRVSKAVDLPVAKSTLYKWRHINKFPGLFVKLSGALFVDRDAFNTIIEKGRLGGQADGK
jgi:hypothetical protein